LVLTNLLFGNLKAFKQELTAPINEVAEYVQSKAISSVASVVLPDITSGLNPQKINACRASLSALSTEQAVLALSSKGATAEQIKQILVTDQVSDEMVEAAMAQAALVTTTEGLEASIRDLSISEASELLIKQGLQKEEAESLTTKLLSIAAQEGQEISTDNLTKETLELALATDYLSDQEKEHILTLLGVVKAEGVATGTTNVLSKSIKKLWTAMATNPIGWIIGAIGACVALGAALEGLKDIRINTLDELTEIYDEQINKLEEEQDKLDGLKDSLNETKSRFDELNDARLSGEITTAELKELAVLKEQTAQYQAQYDLQQKQLEAQQAQTAAALAEVEARKKTLEKEKEKTEKWDKHFDAYGWINSAPTFFIPQIGKAISKSLFGDDSGITKFFDKFENLATGRTFAEAVLGIDFEESESYATFEEKINSFKEKRKELNSLINDYNQGKSVDADKYLKVQGEFGEISSNIQEEYNQILESIEVYSTDKTGIYDQKIAELQKQKIEIEKLLGIFDATELTKQEKIDYIKENLSTISEFGYTWDFAEEYAKYKDDFEGFYDSLLSSPQAIEAALAIIKDGHIFNSATEFAEMLESYINTSNKIEKESRKTFNDVWNSDSFKETREELLDLAKSGELTEETLETTEEYNDLLDKTGLKASQAKGKILDLLTATEKLAMADAGTESLTSAYEEYLEKGFVTASTLDSMPDLFKELDGFNAFESVVNNTKSTKTEVQDAFDSILTEWYIANGVMRGITEETKQQYIDNLKDMNVANAEEVANGALQQSELLYQFEKEYYSYLNNEGQTYSDYITSKGEIDEEYFTAVGDASALLFSQLGEAYQDDLNNWIELVEKKGEAYIELQKAMAMSTTLNPTQVIEATNIKATSGKDLFDGSLMGGLKAQNGEVDDNLANYVEKYQSDSQAAYDKYVEEVDAAWNKIQIGLATIKTGFEFDTKGIEEASSSSNTFDWIEIKLENLNEELEKFKEKAEDSFNGWEVRDDAFKDAKGKIQELITAQEEAKLRYLEEANKSGISESDKSLVQDGAIDIDKISDEKRREQIESYQEWYEKAEACDEAIVQLNKDSLQLDRDHRSFRWEIFDYLEEQISRVTEEADYLIELLSNEDLFDDNGLRTKYADATLGLHISKMDTYKQLATDQLDEIRSLEEEVISGSADQETIDRYNTLIDAHRDNINAMNDEKQAVLDLIEEGYNAQLDALNDLIDKKKEALNAEKDLHDYQSSISEKTKNIASLEKRKLALSGDSSEEAKSQLQKINVELEEAKKDLEQTEYEKMISDQEAMFDKLSSDYEEWIEARLENSDALLEGIRSEIETEGKNILGTLNEVAGKNDPNVSKELGTSVEDGALVSINNYLGELIELLKGNSSFASKLGTINGYASGTKRSKKEWAWTQEKGVEIIRTKDGALLTPLDNSMVFNNESSKRLWEFAQNPSGFISKLIDGIIQPQINLIANIPSHIKDAASNVMQNTTYMEVVLPNVANYDEFMTRMQNDKRFDNIITSSMIGKFTGGNSLSKYKW